ncbi:MAG: S1/P1 nuclease [Proteobacteria bacterium]|nr:S1/P1 nuclease [Pseudomonadota bacterium]
MVRRIQFVLACLLCVVPALAAAWGPKGHEYSGAVADQLLTPRVRAEVQKILGMSLRDASTWGDCVKNVGGPPDFKYTPMPRYSAACSRFGTPEGINRMRSYVRRNWDNCSRKPGEEACHKSYHYADVAIQHYRYDREYTGTSDHDIVSAINAAIAVLRGTPTLPPFGIADKQEALLMLAHLVGDVHQPLHVGAVYLDAEDRPFDPDAPGHTHDRSTETHGGNIIDVGSNNMHAEWDQVLHSLNPDKIDPKAIAWAAAIPETDAPLDSWAAIWASDTLAAARIAYTGISYAHPGTKGTWSARFDDRKKYLVMKREIQNQQLVKAGARLGQVLNSALK